VISSRYVLYTAASGTYLALEVPYTREAEKFTAYSTLCTQLSAVNYIALHIIKKVEVQLVPFICTRKLQ